MNGIQIPATVVPVVTWIAGVLGGKGVFGFDSAIWTTILSGIAMIGLSIYTGFVTRKSALTTTVANMTEVRNIELEPNAPGTKDLNAATPSNVKVAA